MKKYEFNGLAGCVVQSRARTTRTIVGVYNSVQSGMENDPSIPWLTVCEEHGEVVGHCTLAIAREWASAPDTWCEDCQENRKSSTHE
jgi:hypothetical protein